MSLASGKSNVRLVQNEEGKWFYPATQRSDGSWRKPIPVRDTYSPPELQEKYVCRGRREADAAAAASNLSIKQEQVVLEEEDTTDFRMDRNKKDESAKETSSTAKKSGPRTFSMPRMDLYWNHYVSADPVVSSEPQAPPTSATASNADPVDNCDGPRKGDRRNAENSWKSPTCQNVATVPVVDFEEKCRSWKNTEDVCDKLGDLNISENRAEEERKFAALLDKEKDADLKDFESLVMDNELSPPDYVNSWNYLVTKWIHIQQMLGIASKADIVKMAKSNKLMM